MLWSGTARLSVWLGIALGMLAAAAPALETAGRPEPVDVAARGAGVVLEASAVGAAAALSGVVDASFVGLATGLAGLAVISGRSSRRR